MSVEAAAAWYEYGHALLLKEEDNPSNDLLGNVQGEPNQPPPEDEDVGDDDGPDEEAGTDGENGEGGEDPDEVEGDLQIAWEALDVGSSQEKCIGLLVFNTIDFFVGRESYSGEARGCRYEHLAL